MQKFNLYTNNHTNSQIRNLSDTTNAVVLVANSGQTVSVPTSGNLVLFSSTGNFYANTNDSAISIPTGNITDGTAPEANPTTWQLTSVATGISLISDAPNVVCLSYYTHH